MGGTAWCETNIVIGSMQSDVLYIQIPNLISRYVLRETSRLPLQMLHVNILQIVAGHGAVVQPVSINNVFGCKQVPQYSRKHQ